MNGLPGGVPPTPAEQPLARLHHIVEQALLLSYGRGEGPPPAVVDAMAQTLRNVYELSGRRQPLHQWLGVALGVDPEQADLLAVLALRRILDEAQASPIDAELVPLTEEEEQEDMEKAAEASELFATVADDLPREPG